MEKITLNKKEINKLKGLWDYLTEEHSDYEYCISNNRISKYKELKEKLKGLPRKVVRRMYQILELTNYSFMDSSTFTIGEFLEEKGGNYGC